ncbi:agmatine deiminase family protein [Aliikangiella sp. IMCC44359]|uniref:agmatine deiminase family protein n=1 Tax=Aliikangiella sp. IMCC44359 TaxID=3459125 RepID=UPI00403AEE73
MSNILPPEWVSQDAVMLTWPHANTDWKSNLREVEAVFISISLAIVSRQKLLIVCHDKTLKKHICQLLQQSAVITKNIQFIVTETNDSWTRDHGPISVFNQQGEVIALNFIFNGWGEKYPAKLDNQINQALFEQLDINNWRNIDVVLEGGSIDIDEQGHLLTTKRCLLNANRNQNITQAIMEAMLKTQLGAKKILWLNYGALEGDDTDSHIDTLARFAPNQTIIYQGCDDENYRYYVELERMKQALSNMRSLKEEPFKLLELPWPDAQFNINGERLPATYANFLIINDAVLVPSYGVVQDKSARDVIQLAFPEREIIAINCRPIIEQFGSLHCLTMQLPQGFFSV